MRYIFILILLLPFSLLASNTAQISQLFNRLKQDPQALRIFLHNMPKGGELHYHWDGSSYPENMAYDIRNSTFCYNAKVVGVDLNNKLCPTSKRLNHFASKPVLYQTLVNNWSLTANYDNRVRTEDHFFQFFFGTEPIMAKYSGAMLADEIRRAANQHEDYMEMIYILDLPEMVSLGKRIKFNPNFAIMRNNIITSGAIDLANKIKTSTDDYYRQAHKIMRCGTSQAENGCKVKVRFLISAMRNMQRSVVFTQMLIGFMVANEDRYVVGFNIVGPENDYNASHDYKLQMQMLHYLHQQYPNVKMSLHAGELSLAEAPPNFMRNHVAEAINIAGAQRIGHGVDIAYENDSIRTLHEMAKKHICVEQLLTSNEKLLAIKGAQHPLPLYLHYHVPIVLGTDDEGILRTDLTNEYWKAVTGYNLSYKQIKSMSRNVLSYDFLPGKNLWTNLNKYTPVKACQKQLLGGRTPSKPCEEFLNHSEKARLQWKLEGQYRKFEHTITAYMA